jgi:hypothetical protein
MTSTGSLSYATLRVCCQRHAPARMKLNVPALSRLQGIEGLQTTRLGYRLYEREPTVLRLLLSFPGMFLSNMSGMVKQMANHRLHVEAQCQKTSAID